MPTPERADVVIIGAGVAGLTLASKIAGSHDGLTVLVIGPEDNRNQRLSFWIDNSSAAVYEAFLTHQWQTWSFNHSRSGHSSHHARHQRYVSLDARLYKKHLRKALVERGGHLQATAVTRIKINHANTVVYTSDEAITAATVIDTRAPLIPETTLKQQFWGCVVDLPRTHGLTAPILMDFDVTPIAGDGVTFIYVLPLTSSQLLVEATTFSTRLQAESDYHHCVRVWLQQHFDYTLTIEPDKSETGILPMGPVIPLEPGIPRCGLAGGAARSSTGYAFQGIERQAAFMASQLSAGKQPETRSPFSRKTDWMDRVFLQVAKERPDQLEILFMAMAQRLSGDEFAHFLSDTGGWMPGLRAVMVAPKLAFMGAALRLAWARPWI
jgi:lycopene beta-cyclase